MTKKCTDKVLIRLVCGAYLVRLGIAQSLLLHAQVTHLRHEPVRVDEEARAEQKCEDIRSLRRQNKTNHRDKLVIYA